MCAVQLNYSVHYGRTIYYEKCDKNITRNGAGIYCSDCSMVYGENPG